MSSPLGHVDFFFLLVVRYPPLTVVIIRPCVSLIELPVAELLASPILEARQCSSSIVCDKVPQSSSAVSKTSSPVHHLGFPRLAFPHAFGIGIAESLLEEHVVSSLASPSSKDTSMIFSVLFSSSDCSASSRPS